jgi:hypothetical protein
MNERTVVAHARGVIVLKAGIQWLDGIQCLVVDYWPSATLFYLYRRNVNFVACCT